jgi:hypothetical protein
VVVAALVVVGGGWVPDVGLDPPFVVAVVGVDVATVVGVLPPEEPVGHR